MRAWVFVNLKRQKAEHSVQRNTISQPKILRGRLVEDWWLSSSGSPSTPAHCIIHAMPWLHLMFMCGFTQPMRTHRVPRTPRNPAWIVLAFLDRAGNLVLILTGPHAIDSCTACRSTDSFAATPGNPRFPLAGQHIVANTTRTTLTHASPPSSQTPRTTTFDDRPPRDDALRSPRLGALTRRQGARLVPLGARIGDHGRSRRRTRSAAARSFELRWQLVCPPAPPVLALSLACA